MSGIPETSTRWFISSISIGNAIGRLSAGLIATLFSHLNTCYLVGCMTISAGCITIISAYVGTSDVSVQIGYCIVLGFCIGKEFLFDGECIFHKYISYCSLPISSTPDYCRKAIGTAKANQCLWTVCCCDWYWTTIWNANSIGIASKDAHIFGDLCVVWHFVHCEWSAHYFGFPYLLVARA